MSVRQRIERRCVVGAEHAGRRIDQAAAAIWPDYSRSRISDWIRAGWLRIDGRIVKPNHRLAGGETLALDAELERHETNPEPEPIRLDVVYGDPEILIVDKPPGLVVHPGSGNTTGTLVNGLLHHDPSLETLPRAGLVHRLDKDTSGCLLVARTPQSHHRLVAALKRREIHRHYKALVWGEVISGGQVDAPIGRHPVDRRRQVVRSDGRRAVTHYRIAERLAGATLLDVQLETGRTHQIRVHMAHLGFPIVGDPVYGRRGSPGGLSDAQRTAWRTFRRQALHAGRIEFEHPVEGGRVEAVAPVPADFRGLIAELRDPAKAS